VGNLNSLLWGGIDHRVSTLRVLLGTEELLLAVLSLLLLLDKVAKSAAPGLGEIREAVSLEVILGPELSALHGLWNAVEADAGSGDEEKARGVDWFVSLKATILLVAMVNLAKGYARAAVGEQAGVNRIAAAEESRGPVLSITSALGVDDLASIAENVVEPVLPVIDILVVNGATLGWSWSWRSNGMINWAVHF